MAKIAIIYYSTYGHIAQLAEAAKKGVESVDGVTAEIYQEADGILFGFPTRFGSLPAQVKAFFDSAGGLWASGALVGKPAGIFFSTGSQGGGQETTAFTALTFLAHQGLTFVPLGYRAPELFNMDEIHGGSPWGAGTLANGDGSRQPSKLELTVATTQGKSFAEVAKKLAA
ncbi:Flavoprotein-like domain [Phytophthora cactorum]|nr:Flavoprotein-like domain [Phytophthora cactorum]